MKQRNCPYEGTVTVGIVSLHVSECQSSACPCKEENDLYDVQRDQFSDRTGRIANQRP